MKRLLCYFCLLTCLSGRAQEERLLWEVEANVALDNYGCWSIEPSVTFQPLRYVGLTIGLWYNEPISTDYAFSGTTFDNRLIWSVSDGESIGKTLAFRSSFRLVTPSVHLGNDKEYELYFAVSPGITVPFVPNRRVDIDYFPNQAGVWSALLRESVKNHGARKAFVYIRSALTLKMDDRLTLSLGYTCSDFDPYASVRNLFWEGKRFEAEKHRLAHNVSIGIGVCF